MSISRFKFLATPLLLLVLLPAAAPAQAELWDIHFDLAVKAVKAGNVGAAQAFSLAALKEAEKLDKGDRKRLDPRLAISLFLTGKVFFDQEKKEEAYAYWKRIEGRLDVKDLVGLLDLAKKLDSLADVYFARGKEAQKKYNSSQDGPDREKVSDKMSLNFATAQRFWLIVLATRQKVLGDDHPAVAKTCTDLALDYYNMGGKENDEQSIEYFERALKIRRRENSFAANVVQNGYEALVSKPVVREPLIRWGEEMSYVLVLLGNVYRRHDQNEKAEGSCKDALKLWEDHWPEHQNTALPLTMLGRLYRDQKRFEDASRLFQRAMDILEKVYGPEHEYVATALEDYALVLKDLRRDSEASQVESRAKAIRAKHN